MKHDDYIVFFLRENMMTCVLLRENMMYEQKRSENLKEFGIDPKYKPTAVHLI